MKKDLRVVTCLLFIFAVEVCGHIIGLNQKEVKATPAEVVSLVPAEITPAVYISHQTDNYVTANVMTKQDVVDRIIPDEPETVLSEKDIELIALLTMGEAEGEYEYGQRLVIDTVLNRMDSVYFPDTAYDVIYQTNQFSCMWNGRMKSCHVKDELCELVREEMRSRTNSEVVFFTAGDYGKYGKHLFKAGNHYFCSYE